MRMVRLTTEVVRVVREPTRERVAMRRREGFSFFLYEYKLRRGRIKRAVR